MSKTNEIWVCAGERRGASNGKPIMCLAWFQVLDGQIAGEAMLFPKMKGAYAGNTYEVKATRKADTITMQLGKRIGPFDNEALEAEWSALSAAARAEARAVANERKDKKHADDAFERYLMPVRRAYQRSGDALGREVILARVIRFITRL